MPSPTDASVLQSLWTVAKAQESNFLITQEQSRFDFNVGYIISSVLAIFFLFLGAAVLNPLTTAMLSDNEGFARQLLKVYTTLIGDWSFYAIAFTALLVMLSTTLAVNDGMTRMAIAIGKEFFPRIRWGSHYHYKLVLLCLSVLAVFVIYLLLNSFTRFMDLTSIIVFLIGPFLALLNHLAIFGNKVPKAEQPSLFIKTWSTLSITCLFLLMAAYVYFRLK
jgi:amino acid transporter